MAGETRDHNIIVKPGPIIFAAGTINS